MSEDINAPQFPVSEQTQLERKKELEKANMFREESERIRDLADVEPTPSLEKICREIVAGKYDGQLDKITSAMDTRRADRRDEVLRLVKEVYGYEAKITTGAIAEVQLVPDNPFVKRAQVRKSDETLPGPYRIDPGNGNARRASGPEDQEGFITITDIFGGHEGRVHKDVWNMWEQADDDDQVVEEVISDVERQMVAEGKIENLPIEQRGAIIGGLSSADIAD